LNRAQLLPLKKRRDLPAPRRIVLASARNGGEKRISPIGTASFERANFNHPFAAAAIYYNDEVGIRAMAAAIAWERRAPVLPDPAAALVTIELRDQSGRMLPGLIVGDRWFVVGEEGRRYSIVVRNRSDLRLEVVLSVDGLDVIDGRPASFRKRGYILNPHQKLVVEDFGKARKRWRPFASDRYANLTPPRNITTLATPGSSASPCSTKWAPTRGPTRKCAVV
jgi:hypothetical protein